MPKLPPVRAGVGPVQLPVVATPVPSKENKFVEAAELQTAKVLLTPAYEPGVTVTH